MELAIRGQNFHVGEKLSEMVKTRIDFALGQFESWITDVMVHLEDVNGPKGGVDKQCRVLVNLRGGKTIKIEDIDIDFPAAIHRAADRLGHVVGKEIDKKREKRSSTIED